MRRTLFLLGCLTSIPFVAACGGGGTPPPPPPPPVTLSVIPASSSVTIGTTQLFTFSVSSGVPPAVNWSVNGVPGGNATVGIIDTSGLYHSPATFPTPNTFTVTATEQTDATKTASASVIVTYPNDNNLSQTNPIKMGTSGGNSTDSVVSGTTTTCCSGTLGSLLSRGGVTYILSNNHVLDKSDKGAVNDPITQPGLVDTKCQPSADIVAHLSEAAPLQTSNADAAIAQAVAGTVDTTGAILDLGAANGTTIAAAPPSSTLAVPASVFSTNEQVAKSGRSTGLTCSTLQSVGTNVRVSYDTACGGTVAFMVLFTNQVIINGGKFSASGDSGSLVVTADTARPVGLLFAGNTTSSTANPIQDIIAKFTSAAGAPTIVGGGDHAVSCVPTAINSAAVSAGPSAANLSSQEIERATETRDRNAPQLMQDLAITRVEVGASADNPKEAAVVIHLSGPPTRSIPQALDGVRTRVIFGGDSAGQPQSGVAQRVGLPLESIQGAMAVKDAHAERLMAQEAIQGVGVGISDDNPAEPALVIYVETGKQYTPIPPVIDRLRTKIVEGDRFRAFGWGKETKSPAACSGKQGNIASPRPVRESKQK